jgi:ribosomal protein S15P/S13E
MSKKQIAILLFVGFSTLGAVACSNSAQTSQNVNNSSPNSNSSSVVSSHSSEKTTPPVSTNPANSASSSSNSPMAKTVDVAEMTAKIEKADKDFKAKPKDEKAKQALATAYFERAFALTEAAQYRSALGDFRKGLKLNPDDKEAKAMHDQIITIFKSIGREPPKEGEEPSPMPIK